VAGEAMKKNQRSKYARLFELLGALGKGQITKDSFWKRMEQEQLTDSDIDAFLGGEISPKTRMDF
jgi:hypothetical protein